MVRQNKARCFLCNQDITHPTHFNLIFLRYHHASQISPCISDITVHLRYHHASQISPCISDITVHLRYHHSPISPCCLRAASTLTPLHSCMESLNLFHGLHRARCGKYECSLNRCIAAKQATLSTSLHSCVDSPNLFRGLRCAVWQIKVQFKNVHCKSKPLSILPCTHSCRQPQSLPWPTACNVAD